MNTKHTPGPWVLHEDGRSIYTDHTNEAGMFSIAQGFAGNDAAMDRANLALAAAAPDLLAALVAIAEGNTMKGKLRYSHAEVIQEHYRIARAALVKATAQQ